MASMNEKNTHRTGKNKSMKRFQILSLDGGGIKGIFSAALLAYIEEDLQTDIVKHFDLIVGTSTGGIIALGLGLGMRPKEIIEFYVQEGRKIFPPRRRFDVRSLRQFIRYKHNRRPLEDALKDCFGEKLLGESRKRLVIPAFNLADNDVKLFKTAHHERLRRDYKVQTWKVAMATSAAPTYFPAFNCIDHMKLIDGGVWANNPIMVGLTEAVGMLDVDLDNIAILSIGTLEDLPKRPAESLSKGGLWQWRKYGVKVLFSGQNLGAANQVSLILGRDRVLRINPKVPEGEYQMDCYNPDDYIGKAAHYSQHDMPKIHSMFLEHMHRNLFRITLFPAEYDNHVHQAT